MFSVYTATFLVAVFAPVNQRVICRICGNGSVVSVLSCDLEY